MCECFHHYSSIISTVFFLNATFPLAMSMIQDYALVKFLHLHGTGSVSLPCLDLFLSLSFSYYVNNIYSPKIYNVYICISCKRYNFYWRTFFLLSDFSGFLLNCIEMFYLNQIIMKTISTNLVFTNFPKYAEMYNEQLSILLWIKLSW